MRIAECGLRNKELGRPSRRLIASPCLFTLRFFHSAFRNPHSALFLLALLAGCGGDSADRARVYGTVTFDSVPIEEGSITFIPADGTRGPTSGGEIKVGRYDISQTKGPMIGTSRVEIRGSRNTGKQIQSPLGGMIDERIDIVPPIYHEQSTLKRQIQPGDNQLDFDLKTGGVE